MPYLLTVGITLIVCLLQPLVWKGTRFYKTNVYLNILWQTSLKFKNNTRLKFHEDVRISVYSMCNPAFRCSFVLSI